MLTVLHLLDSFFTGGMELLYNGIDVGNPAKVAMHYSGLAASAITD